MTDEGIELVLTVMEAKDLIGPPDAEQFDTFVRIYMVPDDTNPQQTKVFSFISIQCEDKHKDAHTNMHNFCFVFILFSLCYNKRLFSLAFISTAIPKFKMSKLQ